MFQTLSNWESSVFLSRAALVFSVAVLGGAIGCDREPQINVVPAKGVVSLDGAPASGVALTFLPAEGMDGPRGNAMTDAEGRFEAKVSADAVGLAPGSYRVLFSKIVMPDGSPIPPDVMAADVGAENVLHPAYRDPSATPVGVTIPESGAEDLTLEIQSRPRI